MAKYTYYGFVYQQNPNSPELFAFVGSADNLKKICGVARKDEHHLTNYQRALDENRVRAEVTPFFRCPENCSPTAIVISLQKTPISTIKFEDQQVTGIPTALPHTFRSLEIEFTDPAGLPKDQIIAYMKDFLDRRLASGAPEELAEREEQGQPEERGENTDGEAVPQSNDETGGEQSTDETSPEADEDSEEEEIEIGTSMLQKIRAQLERPEDINEEMLDAYRDMLKPALVIDGQHRLFGAAAVEEEIPFLVCALVEPAWKEQVFQFTVINDKAQGIKKPFITSLAGMSLTGTELAELRTRLQQAGIHLWEVEVMQRIAYDSTSPFREMIDFRLNPKAASGAGGLGYQTMKALGRAWYEGRNAASVLLRMVDKIHRPAKRKKPLGKRVLQQHLQHDPGYWFEFYTSFWARVRNKFEPEALWQIGSSNLMIAVVLLQFQTVFLTQLSSNFDLTIGEVTGETEEDLRTKVHTEYIKVIDNFLKKFTAKHFERPFRGALNQQDGKADLVDYFTKVFSGQSVAKHNIFKKAAV